MKCVHESSVTIFKCTANWYGYSTGWKCLHLWDWVLKSGIVRLRVGICYAGFKCRLHHHLDLTNQTNNRLSDTMLNTSTKILHVSIRCNSHNYGLTHTHNVMESRNWWKFAIFPPLLIRYVFVYQFSWYFIDFWFKLKFSYPEIEFQARTLTRFFLNW